MQESHTSNRGIRKQLDATGLEAQQSGLTWVGFAHEGQTEHPHVHVIAFTDGKLERDDLSTMREDGDRAAERVLERERGLERDPMLEQLDRERQREVERERSRGFDLER